MDWSKCCDKGKSNKINENNNRHFWNYNDPSENSRMSLFDLCYFIFIFYVKKAKNFTNKKKIKIKKINVLLQINNETFIHFIISMHFFINDL